MQGATKGLGATTDKIDALVGRIDALLERESERNHITVTHTQAGMSGWSIAAVVACFFTSVMLLGLAMVVLPEIHDLRAWESIYGRDLAAVKQAQQGLLQREQKDKP